MDDDVPDFLHVDIEHNSTVLSIIEIRIRMVDSKIKYKEIQYAMKYINSIENPIIVAGDFNNNRRGTVDLDWSIKRLDGLFDKNFIRYIPDGSSIYQKNLNHMIMNLPKTIFCKGNKFCNRVI